MFFRLGMLKGGACAALCFVWSYAAELEVPTILSSGARYGASDGISFGTRFW